jgi:hypothetical protein
MACAMSSWDFSIIVFLGGVLEPLPPFLAGGSEPDPLFPDEEWETSESDGGDEDASVCFGLLESESFEEESDDDEEW